MGVLRPRADIPSRRELIRVARFVKYAGCLVCLRRRCDVRPRSPTLQTDSGCFKSWTTTGVMPHNAPPSFLHDLSDLDRAALGTAAARATAYHLGVLLSCILEAEWWRGPRPAPQVSQVCLPDRERL